MQQRDSVRVAPPRAEALPLVTVIVPVRNDAGRLRRCLASIRANRYPATALELLVADNGSTDSSTQVAAEAQAVVLKFPGIRVSEVRNQAARLARGEILAFVDADHELDSDYIPNAVASLQATRAGAIGAAYYAPADGTWVQRMYDAFRQRTSGIRKVEWLGSGSLVVWATVFRDVGGFDSRLETCEDVDFCQRLRRGGHVLFNDDRLRSVHLGDPSTLRALFFGELWRGRDNLRVSLRGPYTLRSLPSIVIPLSNLALMACTLAGLLLGPFGGGWLARYGLAGMALLAAIRFGRMMTRIRNVRPRTLIRAFLVACVYEVSRALALIVRTPHRVRQAGSLSARAVRGVEP